MAIEHADFDGIERLALVTGGEIMSTFDSAVKTKLGTCKLIEEIMIGESTLLRFSGVALGEACTIVIRGATEQIIDEADRSIHDALCVLSSTVREPTIVYGGGCSEMLMANAVSAEASITPGKEAVAMEAFSKALQSLPIAIADNAGLDSAELIHELRACHVLGENTMGLGKSIIMPFCLKKKKVVMLIILILDMKHGTLGCMKAIGITESFAVKRQVLVSAVEAAEMILRVDCIIKAAPRKRVEDNGHC